MSDPVQRQPLDPGLEEAFFRGPGAEPVPAHLPLRARIDPRRALLSVALVVGCAWLLWPLRDEIAFHFAAAEPVLLAQPQDATAVPIGSYVEVHGVLGNKAASMGGFRPGSLRKGPIQVRHLLGSDLFAEFDQAAHADTLTLFAEVTLRGRVLPFDDQSDTEMAAVREYFRARLATEIPVGARLLVVDERPGEMHRYLVVLGLCLAAIAWSLTSLARSARTRVLDDDEA